MNIKKLFVELMAAAKLTFGQVLPAEKCEVPVAIVRENDIEEASED